MVFCVVCCACSSCVRRSAVKTAVRTAALSPARSLARSPAPCYCRCQLLLHGLLRLAMAVVCFILAPAVWWSTRYMSLFLPLVVCFHARWLLLLLLVLHITQLHIHCTFLVHKLIFSVMFDSMGSNVTLKMVLTSLFQNL